jgi:hypothetical protein
MARKCPGCRAMLTYVHYRCTTVGWENGSVSTRGDHEYDDSGTDSREDYSYYCPECDCEIDDGDEWIQGTDDEDTAAQASGWQVGAREEQQWRNVA